MILGPTDDAGPNDEATMESIRADAFERAYAVRWLTALVAQKTTDDGAAEPAVHADGDADADSEEEEEALPVDRANLKKYILGFLRETSFQGLPGLVKQKDLFHKIFWVICISASMCGLYWEMSTFFGKYLQFQATAQVSRVSGKF